MDEYMKWVIGVIFIPILGLIIGLFKRTRVKQKQSQEIHGSGKQSQSQSLED